MEEITEKLQAIKLQPKPFRRKILAPPKMKQTQSLPTQLEETDSDKDMSDEETRMTIQGPDDYMIAPDTEDEFFDNYVINFAYTKPNVKKPI